MAESLLRAAYESANPTWGDYDGWTLPSRFADVAEECRAVRSGCGVVDLSPRGLLRISGRDRQTFLQGMISNDTRLLEPGQGMYATMLEPKGHMIGDMTLYAYPDYYLADTEPGMAAFIARQLDRFIIREKVTVAVEEGTLTRLGVSGPQARDLLSSLVPNYNGLEPPFRCESFPVEGGEGFLLRRDFTGEESYILAVPVEAGIQLWKALAEAGAQPFGQEALETLRVEAGIPRYGADTTVETIPLEAGLMFGINRDKGCYVGQEIIERISSRGHTNRHLVPLRFSGNDVPAPGTTLHRGEKEVGRVTSAVVSPSLGGAVGLGYVRHEAREPGTLLQVGKTVELAVEVLERPLFGSGLPPAIVNA